MLRTWLRIRIAIRVIRVIGSTLRFTIAGVLLTWHYLFKSKLIVWLNKVCCSMLVMFMSVLLVLFRQIIKSNPTFTILNVFKFSTDFFFTMTCLLNCLPEVRKLYDCYCSVFVYIYSIEKLLSWNLAKLGFPMFDCLLPIDFIRMVFIKQIKDLLDLLSCSIA